MPTLRQGYQLPSSADSIHPLLEAETFWRRSQDQPLIDVRSPSEFAAGHLPGATNLPLFSDEERAEVGTIYSRNGHDAAVMRGLEITGPKMAGLAAAAKKIVVTKNDDSKVLVHCWRGGMRSQSFAWLLGTVGLTPTVLDGGYKAFRTHARATITGQWQLMVLSGLTGAGKTRILQQLREVGQQVCDLEGLANHRGSAYGGIGQGDQPSTEQFENDLFACLDSLDSKLPIWVEDEGNRIGRVVVPEEFYQQLRHAPAVFMDVPMEDRVQNLLVDYDSLPIEGLLTATKNIRKSLGGALTDEAVACIETGDLARAAEITLAYYDRAYLKAAKKMPRAEMPTLATVGLNDEEIVARCIAMAQLA